MLTVAEVLKQSVFQQARLVAGRHGLSRPVGWVHTAIVPDAPRFLYGGELVLTTGYNLPESADEQRRYIADMAEKGVAGLVLSVGRYIERAPDAMVEPAEDYSFPLIEISYEQPFVDIAKAINSLIAEEQMALVTGELDIQQRLTQLVLDGGDLPQLANRLAGLLGQSISIENERFEILASANVGEVDEARRFTVSEGRTDPRLLKAIETRGILAEIRQTLRPVFIPPMPEVGLQYERILAPIVVHGDVYGYVWIIAHDRGLTERDSMAISVGATVAALMMLYQEAMHSAEASLKGGLLTQLIQGEAGREAVLTDQALRYRVDLSRQYVLLLVESDARSSQRVHQVYRRVNALLDHHDWRALVGQFAGEVVLVVEASQPLPTITDLIRAECSNGVRLGVSAPQRGAGAVSRAYEQCRQVLLITAKLRDPRPVVSFLELGYLHTLYQAGPVALETNPYVPLVRRLREADEADLLHTLENYLDTGGNATQTARLIHIHRSTLNYRLDRLRDDYGFNLGDPQALFNLQVALKLLRLFEVET